MEFEHDKSKLECRIAVTLGGRPDPRRQPPARAIAKTAFIVRLLGA